jgi:hypothetical protein
MSQENNQFVLRKVPLLELVNTLISIYNRGVDFVDVIGVLDGEQDQIGIAYNDDYINTEEKKKITNIKLSDEDLNELT